MKNYAKGNQGDASVDKGQQPTDVQEITKRGDNAGVSGEEERGTNGHGVQLPEQEKSPTPEGVGLESFCLSTGFIAIWRKCF